MEPSHPRCISPGDRDRHGAAGHSPGWSRPIEPGGRWRSPAQGSARPAFSHGPVDARCASTGKPGIAEVRVAHARGMRGLVIKDHNEPTAPLAYHLRQEISGLELYGGFVLNLPNGGVNPAGVEFMATKIKGEPGRIVWMPAGDTAKEVRASKNSERAVRRRVARRRTAARGQASHRDHRQARIGDCLGPHPPRGGLDGVSRGETSGRAAHDRHPRLRPGRQDDVEQMQEAAKLGAFIEFDFRNTLEDGRMDAIRKVGPEFCFLSEFWTKVECAQGVWRARRRRRLCGEDARPRLHRPGTRPDVQGEPGESAGARGNDDVIGALIARGGRAPVDAAVAPPA